MRRIKHLLAGIFFVQSFVLTAAQESTRENLHNELKRRKWVKAIFEADKEVLQDLVESKIHNVNENVWYDDVSPLHMAWYKDRPDSLQALIYLGADINAQYSHGNTLLHTAITRRFDGEEYSKYQEENYTRYVDATKTIWYSSGMHKSDWVGEMIPFLLAQKGIKVDIPNSEGKTVVDLAVEAKNSSILPCPGIYTLMEELNLINNSSVGSSCREQQAK